MFLELHKTEEDVTGRRFGRLVALGYVEKKGSQKFWLCQCDCGQTKRVDKGNLVQGRTSSCGCVTGDLISANRARHGHARVNAASPEYRTWSGIKRRCLDEGDKSYLRYGGRGILLHPAWAESFEAFLEAVGPRPSKEHSLDRIDNDGHYEPGNVRWATRIEQGNNKRTSVRITAHGETKTLAEWSRDTGVHIGTIWSRLHLLGKSPEEAVAAVSEVPWNARELSFGGKTQGVADWARETGISVWTLYRRLDRRWSVEDVLTKPVRSVSR